MKKVFLAATLVIAIMVAAMDLTVAQKGAARAKVLVVADEMVQMEALAGFLKDEGPCEVQSADQGDLEEDLSGYEAVLMYIHGGMTRRTEKILIGYALGGGRLIILHHGIASARVNNPDWLKMTGIYIAPRDHPERPWKVVGDTTHTIVNLKPGHYITTHNVTWDRTVEYTSSDWPSVAAEYEAFDLPDTEVFLNQHFTDGRAKTVLLGFKCTDAETHKTYMQDRGGWYKPAGNGYVFYFQAGHTAEDFRNRNYAQIILNSLNYRP